MGRMKNYYIEKENEREQESHDAYMSEIFAEKDKEIEKLREENKGLRAKLERAGGENE